MYDYTKTVVVVELSHTECVQEDCHKPIEVELVIGDKRGAFCRQHAEEHIADFAADGYAINRRGVTNAFVVGTNKRGKVLIPSHDMTHLLPRTDAEKSLESHTYDLTEKDINNALDVAFAPKVEPKVKASDVWSDLITVLRTYNMLPNIKVDTVFMIAGNKIKIVTGKNGLVLMREITGTNKYTRMAKDKDILSFMIRLVRDPSLATSNTWVTVTHK